MSGRKTSRKGVFPSLQVPLLLFSSAVSPLELRHRSLPAARPPHERGGGIKRPLSGCIVVVGEAKRGKEREGLLFSSFARLMCVVGPSPTTIPILCFHSATRLRLRFHSVCLLLGLIPWLLALLPSSHRGVEEGRRRPILPAAHLSARRRRRASYFLPPAFFGRRFHAVAAGGKGWRKHILECNDKTSLCKCRNKVRRPGFL